MGSDCPNCKFPFFSRWSLRSGWRGGGGGRWGGSGGGGGYSCGFRPFQCIGLVKGGDPTGPQDPATPGGQSRWTAPLVPFGVGLPLPVAVRGAEMPGARPLLLRGTPPTAHMRPPTPRGSRQAHEETVGALCRRGAHRTQAVQRGSGIGWNVGQIRAGVRRGKGGKGPPKVGCGPALDSSRGCLHTAFIVSSVHRVKGGQEGGGGVAGV